jgi:formamidopyrimidine-DNA glycosylase
MLSQVVSCVGIAYGAISVGLAHAAHVEAALRSAYAASGTREKLTMPELPDVEAYIAALRELIAGRVMVRASIVSPFFLRSVDPPVEAVAGRHVHELTRLGKRIVLSFDDELFAVIHLMVAGRFRWSEKPAAKLPRKLTLAAFHFEHGVLIVTEAGSRRKASLHLVRGANNVRTFDRGGVEPLTATLEEFADALRRENHTLKRSLTDPRLMSGIGNAYADEILLDAGLSPLRLTSKLADDEIARLRASATSVLTTWRDRLTAEFVEHFPGKGDVTAFRPEFGAHGKFGQPCPRCGTKIQRIRYAQNETNYCPRCQTDGRILADRSLSRLLKDDWPRTVDELERDG